MSKSDDEDSDLLATCTEDIDAELGAAIAGAYTAEGIDPDGPADPVKAKAWMERIVREHPALLEELVRRYEKVIPEPEEEEVIPPAAYLIIWMAEHPTVFPWSSEEDAIE